MKGVKMNTSFINSGDNLPDRLRSFVPLQMQKREVLARSDVLGKAQCDVLARLDRLDLERVQFRIAERGSFGVEINGGTLFEGMSETSTTKGLSDAYR